MSADVIAIICCLVIALGIILLKVVNQGPKYEKKNRIDGKVVLITGCNTGIGKETARELARRGGIVYMACKNLQKAQQARDEIIAEGVYCRQLDLSSLESVRKFAETFKKDERKLDILINNAGVFNGAEKLTKDDFEYHMGVNHLGHFLLTNLLLDMLKKPAASRIVVVACNLYEYAKFDTNDTNLESTKTASAFSNYNLSKLANILFAKELSKRLEATGVVVNSVHPGIIQSDLVRNNRCIQFLIKSIGWPFVKTVRSGAQTSICLAIDPEHEKVTGEYFCDSKVRKTASCANDDAVAKWLWEQSANLTKLHDCGV